MSGNTQISRRAHRSLLLQTHDELERKYRQQRHHKDLFEQLLDQSQEEELHLSPHSNPELSETHILSPIKDNRRDDGCKCSKSGCLKLYCICFATGRVCSQTCSCASCSNTEDNQIEVVEARRTVNRRKNGFFDSATKKTQSRCSCRQSGCSKRYCECYKLGVQCGAQCSCTDCGNRTPFGSRCYSVMQ